MSKKKVTKASKRRLLFFGTLSIVVIGYFVFSLTYYGAKIYNLQLEEENLKSNLISLKEDERNLKVEIEKLKDPDYLARFARENYLYSKNGEIVIKVQNDKEIKNEIKPNTDYSFIIFSGSLVLLLIIIYVFRKSKKK